MRRRFSLALVLLGAFAALAVTGASAADFAADDGPCPEPPGGGAVLRCPTGYVGTSYSVQLESEEGSGCSPDYDWFEVVNSALPAGLSMTRDGLISGVPTGAGTTRFWVWNHDLPASQGGPSWCIKDDVSEREFSIEIDPGLAIVNGSLKPATLGQPYSETLATKQVVSLNPPAGPDVQATWSVQSGALPPGIALSAAGILSGTPTSEGSYQFVLRAQSASGLTVTQTYTFVVRKPVSVAATFATPSGRAEVSLRYGVRFSASGGSGTYTWALTSGAPPAGTVFAATGTLAGTPTTPGRYSFVVTATDSEGRTATFPAVVSVAPKLTIRTLRPKTARLGRAYRGRISTAGGVAPLAWKLSGRLPRGVRFVKSLGTFVGTPRREGTYRIGLQVRDALGARAQKSLVLVVRR